MEEFGTFSVILPLPEGNKSHAITTVFVTHLSISKIVIDSQSNAYKWDLLLKNGVAKFYILL